MTEASESGNRVGRILTLVGDLLREMGGLVAEGCPASLPASLSAEVVVPAFPGPEAPAPAPASPAAAAEPPVAATAAEPPPAPRVPEPREEGLFLVCEQPDGRLALPWSWVVGTRLSQEGDPEGFTLSDGQTEREMRVRRVLGLYTRQELAASGEPVRWASSPAEVNGSPPAPAVEPVRPTHALALEKSAREEPCPPEARRAWIASPSALARRFLMRHLVDLGFQVHEARDLDDPTLPADLKGVTALFLDESLLEDWRTRRPTAAGAPPVVLLTVDGALSVPPEGVCPPQGAVLPRPFERSEVERVVRWLCTLRRGAGSGGSWEHGDEEDDTWLFADPFGTARAGEHSRR